MSSSINGEIETVNATSSNAQHSAARLGSVIYLSIVGTVGLIANGLVIAAFWRYRKLRIATKNLFILNLAVCDLVLAILDTAFSISSSLHGRWLFGAVGCNIYGFFHYFFISNTVSTLAAISVDRFYYITKPGRVHTSVITKTRAGIMIGIVYFYTFVLTIPPAIGWNSFVEEKHFFSGCYIDYSDQNAASISYSIAASVCLFLVPLAIMLYCYIKIFLAVRKSTHRTISRQSSSIGIPGSSVKKKFPLMKRTHVQTAKLIVVAVFFSMIVWVPYVAVSLAKAFSGGNGISPLTSHITVLIAKSCVIYNVLIYVVLNRKFKAAILDMVCCGKNPGGRLFNNYGLGTSARQRLSRILSDTDRELPSQIVENQRNRLTILNSPQLRLQSRSLPNGLLEGKTSKCAETEGSFVSSMEPSKNRYGTYSHKSVEFEDEIAFENLLKGDDKLRTGVNGHGSVTRSEPESESKTIKTLKSNLKNSHTQGKFVADKAKADTVSNSKESDNIMEQTSDLEVSTTSANSHANSETKSLTLSEARWKALGKIRALSRRQLPDTPRDVNFKTKGAPGTFDMPDNVEIRNGNNEPRPHVNCADKGAQKVISRNPTATESSANAKRTDSLSQKGGMLSSYKLVRAASQRKSAVTVPKKPTRHLNSKKEVLSSRESIRSLYSRNESFRCQNDIENRSRTSEHQRSCSPGDDIPQKRQSRTRRSASHRDGNKRTKHGTRTSRRNSSIRGYATNPRPLSADSLKTPPKELENIQNYWKRMSLCLDDIDLDAETGVPV